MRGGHESRGRDLPRTAEALAAKYAADWPAWSHRKIAAMMRGDGHQASTSTVERALPPWAAAAGGDRGIVDELPAAMPAQNTW